MVISGSYAEKSVMQPFGRKLHTHFLLHHCYLYELTRVVSVT